MKKFRTASAVLLLLAMMLTVTACGDKKDTEAPAKDTGSASAQAEENTGTLTESDLGSASVEQSDTDASADSSDTEAVSTEDSKDSGSLDSGNVSITYGDYVIAVTGCEETTDVNDCPAVRVSYSFTNNSSSRAAFSTSVITYAYQNELRLANSSPAEQDDEYSAQIQFADPGESIDCAAYYLLDNTSDDVRIEVTNLLNHTDEALSVSYQLAGGTAEDTASEDSTSESGTAEDSTSDSSTGN